jgi:hypothetical protein
MFDRCLDPDVLIDVFPRCLGARNEIELGARNEIEKGRH